MMGYGKRFGYKMSWLAICTEDTHAVIDALGLSEPQEVDWELAIQTIYEDRTAGYVFITPPIDGWTLVTWGRAWNWQPAEVAVTRLSARFGEAQSFSSDRVVEYHYWMLAKNGKLLRSFAYIGQEGELLTDTGDPTPIELSLNINLEVPDDFDPFSDEENPFHAPNEHDVMAVAAAWSVDPTTFDERPDIPDTGIHAIAPR